jgi:transposase-like protein
MRKGIRRGDPQRQRYWEAVVRRCREGGQSVRAFCRAEGLRESAFYFWRRKLARRSPPSSTVGQPRLEASTLARAAPSPKRLSPPRRRPASFLPVRVVGPASGCPAATETTRGVEIVLEQGRAVRVQAGFDRQTLADVLAVLEGRPC